MIGLLIKAQQTNKKQKHPSLGRNPVGQLLPAVAHRWDECEMGSSICNLKGVVRKDRKEGMQEYRSKIASCINNNNKADDEDDEDTDIGISDLTLLFQRDGRKKNERVLAVTTRRRMRRRCCPDAHLFPVSLFSFS